jgi:hypothetical protein
MREGVSLANVLCESQSTGTLTNKMHACMVYINADSQLQYLSFLLFNIQVRGLFGDRRLASTIGRRILKSLPDRNCLKPKVWAQHKTIPTRVGVSLRVRSFVRPLYLCIKLSQLRNVENVHGQLQNVEAFGMLRSKAKEPCVSCQFFFGFKSLHPVGNCAEYDVIGNVKPHLLQTTEWQEFRSACQQHLNAFNTMLSMLARPRYSYRQIRETMRTYFARTRYPERPKVLKYQWNPIGEVFELILEDWPPVRRVRPN